jgi:hypothetical protein
VLIAKGVRSVPSCKACGGRLKKAEEQAALMWMMAHGFDRDHPLGGHPKPATDGRLKAGHQE